MTLYLSANTTIPDLVIDYIEVRLASGESVSLNWDTSEISRRATGFDARYQGIYFGEDYANGRLKELEGMVITDVGLYSEGKEFLSVFISLMEFHDNGTCLEFVPPTIEEGGAGYAESK